MIPVSRPHLSRPIVIAAVTALLALHAWLAVSATIDLGITGDETVHLTGGYSYWKFNDYRLHPENGNLPQRWAALPLVFAHANLDPLAWPSDWKNSNPWMAGQHFFFESGNPIDYLLLCARSMSVVWSVATGLLVFFWSRQLWGDVGGVFSLVLFILSPTTLAHGALVTSDMCATFWLLAATGAWWRVTERMTASRLIPSLIAVGCASISKFSVGVLIPVFTMIAGWRLVESRLRSNDLQTPPDKISRQVLLISFLTAIHVVAVFGIIWLSYGCRYTAFAPSLPGGANFFSSGPGMLPSNGLTRSVLSWLQQHTLLPAAFIQGLTYVLYAARERPAFAAGEYSSTGWWWFFPFTFMVKSSLAELLTIVVVSLLAVRRWTSRKPYVAAFKPLIPLVAFASIYGAFAITSHLNIGHRHLLPIYPVLFILAGFVVARRKADDHPVDCKKTSDLSCASLPGADSAGFSPLRISFGCALIALALAEECGARPHYLAFFNVASGGPSAGQFLLSDSSLDWGQGLPNLSKWLSSHRQGNEKVYLSYFGADDAKYRGIIATELAPYYSFGRERRWGKLYNGLYCVGISMLQDAASPYKGQWTLASEARYQGLLARYGANLSGKIIASADDVNLDLWDLERARFARLLQLLRVSTPVAVVDRTILIFRLSQSDVDDATAGSLKQLLGVIERNARPD